MIDSPSSLKRHHHWLTTFALVSAALSSCRGSFAGSFSASAPNHCCLSQQNGLSAGTAPFTSTSCNSTSSSIPTSNTHPSSESNLQQHVHTSRNLIPRYVGPTENLTTEQAKIRDEIQASRPRTGLSGPFGPWLAIPAIASPAQELGRACRYGTSLSFRESELVILLTGAKTKSHAEFDIHVGEALQAGIDMTTIQCIPRDDAFSLSAVMERVVPRLLDTEGQANAREQAIVEFTAELLATQTVSDATYQKTRAAVGGEDSVLVEITSIIGYYTYVAYTLNVFQIPSS